MSWFEEQIKTRRRLDEKELENAYADLAASVLSRNKMPRLSVDKTAAADAAITEILAYYGVQAKDAPEDIVDPIDRADWAARPSGVMRRPVRLEGLWWKDAIGAYLATTTDGTPVALLPCAPKGYAYTDPSTRAKVRISRKTMKNLNPEALCFYRPLPQRALTITDVARFMMSSLDLADYLLVFGSTLFATIIGLLPPVVTQLLFARIIPSGEPSLILPIAALLIGTSFSQALMHITASVITERISTKLKFQIESATYARILLLPPTFFKNYAAGDLARRVSGMSQLVDILSLSVITTGLSSMLSLLYVFQLVSFAPQLTLPAIAITLVELAATVTSTLQTTNYLRIQMNAQTKLSGLTPSILQGIQKIKLAGAESRSFAHWAHTYAETSAATYQRPALLLAAPALIPLIASLGTVIMYWIAAGTNVSTADYMAFNTAFGSVSGSLAMLSSTATTVATMRPLLELIEPVMKAVPEAVESQRQIESVRGGIEVSNLSFRYSANTPLVLDNVSLRIRPGEYVAIVGRTGCGKSTLMRLLLGFEKQSKGAIYYDGQDITGIDIRSLRRQIGVVMQNGRLLSGDILMNITVSSPRATLDDAWEAAEIAGIADDIRRMPMGMQTLLSEGSGGVSGGQRQRILIARAVCGKPKFLMLDEATSALDNVTQRHVSDALENLNCTRVVIAHRLSTIRHADRIIMLEDGKIVENGSYDELVAAQGAFADLVARQQLEGE